MMCVTRFGRFHFRFPCFYFIIVDPSRQWKFDIGLSINFRCFNRYFSKFRLRFGNDLARFGKSYIRFDNKYLRFGD